MNMVPCVEVVQAHLPYGLAFTGSVLMASLMFAQWKKNMRMAQSLKSV